MRLNDSSENGAGIPDEGTSNNRNFLRLVWPFYTSFFARILFSCILNIHFILLKQTAFPNGMAMLAGGIALLFGLLLPIILCILLRNRRRSFLSGITIFAILDGIALIQVLQPFFAVDGSISPLTAIDWIRCVLYVVSIVLSIYANTSSSVRKFCSKTPLDDRKQLAAAVSSDAESVDSKYVGFRGWLLVFLIFLCVQLNVTLGIMIWSFLKLENSIDVFTFGNALSVSIVLGLPVYICPLFALIRLLKRRLDFRNSYITGAIINTLLVAGILVSPDGKMLGGIRHVMLLVVLCQFVWIIYAYRSRRVLLTCINEKPPKAARIDGQKWKRLY